MNRLTRYCLLLSLIFSVTGFALSQSTVIGTPNAHEYAKAICADNSGNTFVGGTTGPDAFVIKRNAQGVQIWCKRITFPDAPQIPMINTIKILGDTIFGCGYIGELTVKHGGFFFKMNASTGSVYWVQSMMEIGSYLMDISYGNGKYMLCGGNRATGNQLFGKVLSASSATGDIIWQTNSIKYHLVSQSNPAWTSFLHATEIVNGKMFIIGSTHENLGNGGVRVRPVITGITENGVIFLRKIVDLEINSLFYRRVQGLDIKYDGADSLVLLMAHVDNYSNMTFDFTVLMKTDLQLNSGFIKSYTVTGNNYISPNNLIVSNNSYLIQGAADEPLFMLKTDRSGTVDKCIFYETPAVFYSFGFVGNVNGQAESFGNGDFKNGQYYYAQTVEHYPWATMDIHTIQVDEDLNFPNDCSALTPKNVITYNLLVQTPDCLYLEEPDTDIYSVFFNLTDFTFPGQCDNRSLSFNQEVNCSGTSITAIPSGFTQHVFEWSNGATDGSTTVSSNDTLILKITDSKCCYIIDTIVPSISTNYMTMSLPADTLICLHEAAVMHLIFPDIQTNGANLVYLWNDGWNGSTLAVNVSGTYWLDLTSPECGTTRDSITVTFSSLPVIDGDSAISACAISFPVQYSVDQVVNSNTMSWENGIATPQRTIDSTGAYTLTATNVCGSSSFTVTVSENPLPEVSLKSSVDTCLVFGQSIALVPSYVATDETYWSTGTTDDDIAISQSGTYTVIATNECGGDTASSVVTIDFLPELDLPFSLDTCFETGEGFYYTAQGTPGNYSWSSGSQTATELITDIGIYHVTLSNSCGSVTDSMIVNRSANLDLTVPADSLISCLGQINLTGLHIETNYEYEILDEKMNLVTENISRTGWYHIRAFNKCGEMFDSIYINLQENRFFYLPNAFTPNADGFNEYFSWQGENTFVREFLIYNRWGEEVFDGSDPKGWDGNYHGQKCPDGIYTVRLILENCMGIAEEKNGFVTLVR